MRLNGCRFKFEIKKNEKSNIGRQKVVEVSDDTRSSFLESDDNKFKNPFSLSVPAASSNSSTHSRAQKLRLPLVKRLKPYPVLEK